MEADLRALPGRTAMLVRELGREGAPLLAIDAERAGPIGSGFKLWLLAEAARAVRAGERRWDEVVPLGRDVVTSPATARWPAGAPLTLQSATMMMIAVSDNRTTDTLLTRLGRARVDAMAARLGANARGLPLLSTHEAFSLKSQPVLAARWAALPDPAARRAFLAGNRAAIDRAIDLSAFTGRPMAIDSVEWFASPAAMARTLDHLRTDGGETARAILAVNPGVLPQLAARFAYVGFKGGSEAGVVAGHYLVRTKAGRWFAVSGHWYDRDRAVDNARFSAIAGRVLRLLPAD